MLPTNAYSFSYINYLLSTHVNGLLKLNISLPLDKRRMPWNILVVSQLGKELRVRRPINALGPRAPIFRALISVKEAKQLAQHSE